MDYLRSSSELITPRHRKQPPGGGHAVSAVVNIIVSRQLFKVGRQTDSKPSAMPGIEDGCVHFAGIKWWGLRNMWGGRFFPRTI